MTREPGVASAMRRAWAGAGAAWLASLAVLVFWLKGTSTGHLREELKIWQFWSLDASLLLGVLAGAYIVSTMWREVTGRDGRRLVALASLALVLTLGMAPRTNRIFYDEQIYQSVGQNLADLRLAQVCNDGNVEYGRLRCAEGEYNKQPYAYPHLLSVAYRLLGVHPGIAFGVNAAAMALTACAIYLLTIALCGDRDAAWFAGLLLTLIPQQLLWSATAAVEPSGSLASVLAVLCAALYRRRGGLVTLVAVAAAGAYAIQFRPESLLVLPVVALVAWPRLRKDLERPQGWWVAVLFLWLAAVHMGHLFAVRDAGWGTDAARFSRDYIGPNLRVNGRFYFGDERFPIAVTLLAIVGLLAGTRGRAAMSLYFLLFFGIDLVFYAGSYNYGADVRYSLMTYPPLAVLAGGGAAACSRAIARHLPGMPARVLVTALLAFQFLWYAPIVRATTEEAWAARADVTFAASVAAELPGDSYVLTQNPGMFHLWGINAGQMSRAVANPAYARVLATRYPGGLYVHWNFWCNVEDPAQPQLCRRAMALGPTELVREYRERGQRLAFYRLQLPN